MNGAKNLTNSRKSGMKKQVKLALSCKIVNFGKVFAQKVE